MDWLHPEVHSRYFPAFYGPGGQFAAEVVELSIARLGANWTGSAHYVAPGSDDYKDSEFRNAKARIGGGVDVHMPVLHFATGRDTGNPDVDRVRFRDGRHTFAVIRAMGAPAIPTLVPAKQAARLRARFGRE